MREQLYSELDLFIKILRLKKNRCSFERHCRKNGQLPLSTWLIKFGSRQRNKERERESAGNFYKLERSKSGSIQKREQ